MVENRRICLKTNAQQTVKLGSGLIRFKNDFKQLVVRFRIDANFESVLKSSKNNNTKIRLHTLKNAKHIFLSVLFRMLCVLIITLATQLLFTEVKMLFTEVIDFLKQFLNSVKITKR